MTFALDIITYFYYFINIDNFYLFEKYANMIASSEVKHIKSAAGAAERRRNEFFTKKRKRIAAVSCNLDSLLVFGKAVSYRRRTCICDTGRYGHYPVFGG